MLITLWSALATAAILGVLALGIHLWGKRIRSRVVRRLSRLVLAGVAGVGLFSLSVAGYLLWMLAAGQPEEVALSLAPGVKYQRLVVQEPRLIVMHVVEIDLQRGHRFVVTPPVSGAEGMRTLATTASEALDQLGADLVINASFFRPFHDRWFMDYSPHLGERVESIGTTVGDHQRYGLDRPDWPTLCVAEDGRVSLGSIDKHTQHAVSGRDWLIRDGTPAAFPPNDPPYPMTVAGIDAQGQTLWLIVVDGKQPGYSLGITRTEIIELMQSLGIDSAIHLDGGGSATLAIAEASGGHRLLSRPCHTKIPGRQRPVANHFGVVFADNPLHPTKH